MKSTLVFLLMISLLLSVSGCVTVPTEPYDMDSIQSYRDIPGVTEEEVAAVESLKKTRDSFSYGGLLSTMAFVQPDGSYAGFTPKVCELLSSLFGIRFDLILCEWDDLMNRLDRKSLDFTGELTATLRRMEYYYMSYSIAELSFCLYTHADSKAIHTEWDLEGLRVGFLKDTITADLIQEKYPLSFQIVEVATHRMAVSMLESGEIDAFVELSTVDPFFADYDFIRSKEFFSLAYGPVSLSTANPELEPIISVLNKYLAAGGIDKLFDLYREGEHDYAKYKLNQSFTAEEKAYLNDLAERGSKVSVAYENENYPVSFYNREDGEFEGFAVDILAEVSALTGIQFEAATEKDTPWPEILEKLRTGEVSMVTQLLYTDERKEDYLWGSVPFASSYYALLSKRDYPDLAIYQVIRATVGIIDRAGHEDMYHAWFPGSSNTVNYDTHEDALAALEKGEIDLLMASEYTLLHQTNFREKPGFKVNIRFNMPMNSMFGFHKDETVLCAVIDKTLPYINTDMIARGWTDRVFDYSKKYAVQFSVFLSVFVVVLLCVLAALMRLLLKNKRLDKKLKREIATVSSIYSSIPDLIYCKDINCNYLSCNASFEKLAGCKEAELIGKNALEVFTVDPDMAHRFMKGDELVIRENVTLTMEDWYTYPDGSQRLFECVKAPLVQGGKVIGVLGISRDIQEHKEAVEAAQEASKAKSAFLAHMSHEIRTPMNAIAGMTELMLREDLPPAICEYVLSVKHASANLLSLINDILDFSKIEAGSLEIVPAEYLFSSLINDVLIIIRMRVSEKPILFTANIDSRIPNRLIGDETRVRQILLNVLGNAVKYTSEGFISLNVTGEAGEDTVVLTAEVTDSGVGIREENLDKLFGDFVRFDNMKNKHIQGTGLGLAITKNLCQAMDGDVSVRSEYGAGSTFTITIPQKISLREEPFAHVSDPDAKPVLLYETRPVCADSIVRTLDDLGVRCTPAASRREFYEELRRFSYPFVFASSLVSESAKRGIEELGHPHTRLVLLMEFGEVPSVQGVRTIATPVHSASVANILNDMEDNVLYHGNGREKARFIAPAARVLVVDDLSTNLKVVEGLLMSYQMQVDVCKSGAEAVEYVRKHRYDLLFMDHMMPEMDGIEATERIRALEDGSGYYKRVPIIALTANAVSGMKEMFLQSGMDDFLAKPIDTAKLNGLLEKWIPEEKKEKYGENNAKRSPAGEDASPFHIEGIDAEVGIDMTGGTLENYLKTLAIFYMDGRNKLETLRDCMEEDDIKLYINYVHALKSAAASIGAEELSEFAKELEEAGIRGDIHFVREKSERFLAEFETLLHNIDAALSDNQDEEAGESGPEFFRNELVRLKEALENMDAGEVDDIMAMLGAAKWGPESGDLFEEMARNIFLFQYKEAGVLVEKLIRDIV